eukprot:7383801-Prymnesium_polylepis.5
MSRKVDHLMECVRMLTECVRVLLQEYRLSELVPSLLCDRITSTGRVTLAPGEETILPVVRFVPLSVGRRQCHVS